MTLGRWVQRNSVGSMCTKRDVGIFDRCCPVQDSGASGIRATVSGLCAPKGTWVPGTFLSLVGIWSVLIVLWAWFLGKLLWPTFSCCFRCRLAQANYCIIALNRLLRPFWPLPNDCAAVTLCYRAVLAPPPDQWPACVLDADFRRVSEH